MAEGTWITLGPASEIPVGKSKDYEVGDHHILVANVNGAFYAVEDRCSHDDAPLADGKVMMRTCELECPRHGARFDLKTGRAKSLPAFNAIVSYKLRTTDEGVLEANTDVEKPEERHEDPRGIGFGFSL
ncbi:MAG: Rieske (2Fe-2S) protein [Dehalococcoidia bacterium]